MVRYAEYCEIRSIPEQDRFPLTADLAAAFIGWAAGQLGESAVRSWMSGLLAWHTVHGFSFPPPKSEPIRIAHMAVAKLAPTKSKKPPRPPVTLAHLHLLYNNLSFTNAFDIAVWAVACCAFWGLMRLGEATVPSLTYEANRHASRAADLTWSTEKGIRSVAIAIPWTKTTQMRGGTILLTEEQDEVACPHRALEMHLSANSAVPAIGHLFGYATVNGRWRPMIKTDMMARCEEIWTISGLSVPTGHSFRIGGTSHLLARGTDVKIVQRLGRWSSDAFFLYWRNAQAIIPLHVATAAQQDAIRKRVEEHLEGADSDVTTVWQSIEAGRKQDQARQGKRKASKKK